MKGWEETVIVIVCMFLFPDFPAYPPKLILCFVNVLIISVIPAFTCTVFCKLIIPISVAAVAAIIANINIILNVFSFNTADALAAFLILFSKLTRNIGLTAGTYFVIFDMLI